MGSIDYIIIGVIVLVIGAAAAYIIKAKRSGQKCIGCPDSKACGANGKQACSGNCSGCGGTRPSAKKDKK